MSTLVRNFRAILTLFSLQPGPSGRPDCAPWLPGFSRPCHIRLDIASANPPIYKGLDQIPGRQYQRGIDTGKKAPFLPSRSAIDGEFYGHPIFFGEIQAGIQVKRTKFLKIWIMKFRGAEKPISYPRRKIGS